MEVFTSVQSLRTFLNLQISIQNSIGLVPTMGALHEGHLSLIEKSNFENDVTVCSVFVNPTQFNNPEDLLKYPRTLDKDLDMLDKAGCSAVFAPSVEEMYPEQPALQFNFGSLENVMEGSSRPGHFNGVGIVVSKFFNLIKPHRAYFGQKDLQQVAIIRRLIIDLSFDIELIVCPTVREKEGLAMSSRNTRLSKEERELAPQIHQILKLAKSELINGTSVDQVIKLATKEFAMAKAFTLDYFQVVNVKTLQSIEQIGHEGTNAICVAAFLGPVRLIDNLVF
ncbi:pantoate--beta-alanine ligase [Dyadobacter arcticus]|uniref:Pantothenate synthetase n=1 Tax=Dyadobacter arcticus TaxID=1078754 RepID=A0ABX0UHM4_9BACT|nr:pantoate--beta-alanine ligase [Dyadobacter arcticus]NIJ51519.1 pantoate--beta-alanine ligase [Dyadobacter arcticus]